MSTNLNKPASESWSALQTILLFVAVAGIVFALSRLVLLRGSRTVGEKSPAVGQPAPDIHFAALTTPKGIRISEAKGKAILINFWGDWCGPCKVEFPHLVKLTNPYLTRDDFRMVSVNVPGGGGDQEELAADARKFLKAHAAKFEAYLDNDNAAFDALMQVAKEPRGGIPLTVVIDKTGVIAGLWIGYDSGDEEEVARVLAAALDAKS